MSKVNDLIADRISSEDFERWFYDFAYDVEEKSPAEMVELTHEIEGILAEASSGEWPRPALESAIANAAAQARSGRARSAA